MKEPRHSARLRFAIRYSLLAPTNLAMTFELAASGLGLG